MVNNNIIRIQSDLPKVIPNVDRVADFLLFARWFATPKNLREENTQKEFAAKIRVDEDTLTSWKRHEYFWPIAQKFISEWMKERIPDVLNGLYICASNKGEAKAVQTFLQLSRAMNIPKQGKNIIK